MPSRGRPQAFGQFLNSFEAVAAGRADVILRNGEKDPQADDYAVFDGRCIRYVGSDDGFNSSWEGTAGYCPAQQDAYERFPDYGVYVTIEDDTVLHSPGFDDALYFGFLNFPNRVGVVELPDRAGTITALAVSKEWIERVGALYPPELGEHGFRVVKELAIAARRYAKADGYAEYTHLPLLKAYRYQGTERAGSLEQPGVPERFYEQQSWVENVWKPLNFQRLVAEILA